LCSEYEEDHGSRPAQAKSYVNGKKLGVMVNACHLSYKTGKIEGSLPDQLGQKSKTLSQK
jgi:hypothetical protein